MAKVPELLPSANPKGTPIGLDSIQSRLTKYCKERLPGQEVTNLEFSYYHENLGKYGNKYDTWPGPVGGFSFYAPDLETNFIIYRGTGSLSEFYISAGKGFPLENRLDATTSVGDTLEIALPGKMNGNLAAFLTEKSGSVPSVLEMNKKRIAGLEGGKPLLIAGHSLGAAMSLVDAILAVEANKFSEIHVILYAPFNVLNQAGVDYLKDKGVNVYTHILAEDPVPWGGLPLETHTGSRTVPAGNIYEAVLEHKGLDKSEYWRRIKRYLYPEGHFLNTYANGVLQEGFELRDKVDPNMPPKIPVVVKSPEETWPKIEAFALTQEPLVEKKR